MLQQTVPRSAAVKHAILWWTLLAAALCPLFSLVMRTVGMQPLFALTMSDLLHLPSSGPEAAARLANNDFVRAMPRQSAVSNALLLLWAVGASLGMARLAASLLSIQRLRRDATELAGERIDGLVVAIQKSVGQNAPKIMLSQQAGVPMAVGFWRPVVLLPPLVLEHLDDRELTQVLMHECAHAIRRDGLAGLLERLVSAGFWFHHLIYVVNHLLDRTREEVCDNYVLQKEDARGYSSALLAVAQSVSFSADARLAPSLCHRAWSLEERISGLLNTRRSLMTCLNPRSSAAIAAGFVSGALALSCLAAAAASPQMNRGDDFSHVEKLAKTYAKSGDRITVEEVRGRADKWVVGSTYEVGGTYRLASHEKALLAAFVTVHSRPDVHSNPSPEQMVTVSKGEGQFTLRFHMYQEGDPHVSFYPDGGGNDFGGVYLSANRQSGKGSPVSRYEHRSASR